MDKRALRRHLDQSHAKKLIDLNKAESGAKEEIERLKRAAFDRAEGLLKAAATKLGLEVGAQTIDIQSEVGYRDFGIGTCMTIAARRQVDRARAALREVESDKAQLDAEYDRLSVAISLCSGECPEQLATDIKKFCGVA